MKQTHLKKRRIAAGILAAFVCWTAAVRVIDVKAIGPDGSSVGFAAVNSFVHRLTGVHMPLYFLTDWLSIVPIAIAAGFALLGLSQLIHRRSILRVDRSILALGGFYIAVFSAYALFEVCVINYRPILIEGILEPSYPSSTTLLVLSVMITAMMQLKSRISNTRLRRRLLILLSIFTVFMVIGRVISGVHWFSDIIGGMLLSGGLVMAYASIAD